MLKRLLTSHARAVTEARIAKDRQRVLQQANKNHSQRLANAEAQNSAHRVVVGSALLKVEGCVDSEIRMLRLFFLKQELRRGSGSQRESSASKERGSSAMLVEYKLAGLPLPFDAMAMECM